MSDNDIFELSKSTVYSFEELKLDSNFFSRLENFKKYVKLKHKIDIERLLKVNIDVEKYIESLI